MKVKVCKGCLQVMQAKDMATGLPSCVTCLGLSPDSGIEIEVEVPVESSTCVYCKATWKGEGIPPFYDAKHNEHYDGCRGWD